MCWWNSNIASRMPSGEQCKHAFWNQKIFFIIKSTSICPIPKQPSVQIVFVNSQIVWNSNVMFSGWISRLRNFHCFIQRVVIFQTYGHVLFNGWCVCVCVCVCVCCCVFLSVMAMWFFNLFFGSFALIVAIMAVSDIASPELTYTVNRCSFIHDDMINVINFQILLFQTTWIFWHSSIHQNMNNYFRFITKAKRLLRICWSFRICFFNVEHLSQIFEKLIIWSNFRRDVFIFW